MQHMNSSRFITVLFGSLGDTLMALALYDDILTVAPDATLLILMRRNVGMVRELAREYPGIEVREIPDGVQILPFAARILWQRDWTLLMLGLGSSFSWRYQLFFRALRACGSKTIGFYFPFLSVRIGYRIDHSMIENFRSLLPYALPEWRRTVRPPTIKLPKDEPHDFPAAGTYIIVHPFGASIAHTLPPRRFRILFAHLAREHSDKTVVLTGTPAERVRLEELVQDLPVRIRTDLSMTQLVWVLDHTALYIGIDTGVTHLAGVLRQKSLIIRHCSDPSWTPTYNPNARILLNSVHCNPDDPTHCLLIQEDGASYRQCAYDISDKLILDSVDIALSIKERGTPLFAGSVDEGR